MIKINESIMLKHIPTIGTTGFAIYFYLKTLKTKRVRIISIRKTLGLSKNTVVNYLKKLKECKLISIKVKNENGKRTFFVKTNETGSKINPVSSPNIYDISNKSKTLRDIKSKYKKIFKEIIGLALSHKRFDNEYYRNRKQSFGKKEEAHVKRLVENVPSVKSYMTWWLKNKGSRMPGLSIGLITCVPMIEEYRLAQGWRISKETKKEAAEQKKQVDKFQMEMLKNLHDEIKKTKKSGKKYKLTELDRGMIKEGLEDGLLIRKANGKLKLNF